MCSFPDICKEVLGFDNQHWIWTISVNYILIKNVCNNGPFLYRQRSRPNRKFSSLLSFLRFICCWTVFHNLSQKWQGIIVLLRILHKTKQISKHTCCLAFDNSVESKMAADNPGTIFDVEMKFNSPYNFQFLIQVFDKTFDKGLLIISRSQTDPCI